MCIGLLATAAVADMPVGAPYPFTSALEQAPDGMRTNGAWPGSTMTTSAVAESRSFHQHNQRGGLLNDLNRKSLALSSAVVVTRRVFGAGTELCIRTRTKGTVDARVDDWAMAFTRISVDPGRCGGVPCVRTLRIPVATVVSMVAEGQTHEQIVAELPELELEDIREALRYAAEAVRERELPPLSQSS